jgi:predicted secreted protein
LQGNDAGAPKNPNIGKKFLVTTLITTLAFFGIYYIVTNGYFNLREYLQ